MIKIGQIESITIRKKSQNSQKNLRIFKTNMYSQICVNIYLYQRVYSSKYLTKKAWDMSDTKI